jgi:hypothetical protein
VQTEQLEFGILTEAFVRIPFQDIGKYQVGSIMYTIARENKIDLKWHSLRSPISLFLQKASMEWGEVIAMQ